MLQTRETDICRVDLVDLDCPPPRFKFSGKGTILIQADIEFDAKLIESWETITLLDRSEVMIRALRTYREWVVLYSGHQMPLVVSLPEKAELSCTALWVIKPSEYGSFVRIHEADFWDFLPEASISKLKLSQPMPSEKANPSSITHLVTGMKNKPGRQIELITGKVDIDTIDSHPTGRVMFEDSHWLF